MGGSTQSRHVRGYYVRSRSFAGTIAQLCGRRKLQSCAGLLSSVVTVISRPVDLMPAFA